MHALRPIDGHRAPTADAAATTDVGAATAGASDGDARDATPQEAW